MVDSVSVEIGDSVCVVPIMHPLSGDGSSKNLVDTLGRLLSSSPDDLWTCVPVETQIRGQLSVLHSVRDRSNSTRKAGAGEAFAGAGTLIRGLHAIFDTMDSQQMAMRRHLSAHVAQTKIGRR